MPDGGSVVLMSSIEGERGVEGFGAYAAMKAAQQSMARTWANELRGRRIRVNAISPGVICTPAYASKAILDGRRVSLRCSGGVVTELGPR